MYQGIYDDGRQYQLRNPNMSDEEVAFSLTTTSHVVTRNGHFNVPVGTFWVTSGTGNGYDKLIAVRGRDGEIVLCGDYLGSHGRVMLSIADFITGS